MSNKIEIQLTEEPVIGSSTAPLVAVQDWTEYTSDGKRGKRLGSTYEILLLNNSCEKLRVHVEDAAPIIAQEELDKHNKSMNFCMVRFEGFTGRPYADRNGRLAISASAEKIFLVNAGTGVAKA
jgi:hypothetical protein